MKAPPITPQLFRVLSPGEIARENDAIARGDTLEVITRACSLPHRTGIVLRPVPVLAALHLAYEREVCRFRARWDEDAPAERGHDPEYDADLDAREHIRAALLAAGFTE